MKTRPLLARPLALLAVVSILGPASGAMAQPPGYSQWSDPTAPSADSKLQGFVDKLNALVDKAEKARAADPNFLRDLRNLARGFDRPWRTRVFNDQFLDGDFERDPVWAVSAGKYWVERGWGLRSAVKAGTSGGASGESRTLSSEQQAARIFGQILNQALSGKSQQTAAQAPAAAIIHSRVTISNAFSMEMDISSWSTEGQIQLAVYQGNFQNQRSAGYRLGYRPGGTFELTRVSGRGTSIIERAAARHPIEDKQIHRLVWERHPDGRMKIALDGKTVMETSDRGFRDPFDGIALINTGGDYIIKGVNIAGTS